MASTYKRKKTKSKSKAGTAATPRKGVRPINVAAADAGGAVEMKGERLTVRISREAHPEVFEIDKLRKQIRKLIESYASSRKMRDFREFLEETEKSLEIILANHLEDALRKYLD